MWREVVGCVTDDGHRQAGLHVLNVANYNRFELPRIADELRYIHLITRIVGSSKLSKAKKKRIILFTAWYALFLFDVSK